MQGVQDLLRTLRIPGFARLAATYTINDLAAFLATLALSILVYDATGDALATMALFLAAEFVPGLLVPVLAARADGVRPARVLGAAYAVEAVLLGAIALLASSFLLPAVLVLAFLNGTLATLARAVTRAASVAVLEPAGALREGNAIMNVGLSVNSVSGPALAGGLVALIDVGPAMAVIAGVFALLACLIAPARGLPLPRLDDGQGATSTLARLRETAEHVRSSPGLSRLLAGQGLALALLTMVVPIQVIYAKESLGTDDAGFGLFVAAWGCGMVLGSALFARERRRPITQLILLSTTALGVGYIGIGLAPTLAAACAVAVLGGAGNGVQIVAVITAVQEATEERFQARVAGLFEAIATVAPGVGFLVGGVVTALLSPRAAFLVAGAGVLLVVLAGGVMLARRRVAGSAPAIDPIPEPAA
jgi:MFS family permease